MIGVESVVSGTGFAVTAALAVSVIAAVRGVWSPCGLSMISAINPFSERARGHRYWLTALWFVIGSVLGGLLLGMVGAVGAVALDQFALPVGVVAGLAAACCLTTVASDAAVFGFRLPLHPRQVNERWLGRYRRWVYAAGFGAQIGTGFATYIMTAAVYLVPVLGALSGSWEFAVLIGVVFGLVRGAAVLISAGATGPAALRSLHQRLDTLAPWSLAAAVLVQGAAALAFGALSAGAVGVLVVGILLAAAGSAWSAHRRVSAVQGQRSAR